MSTGSEEANVTCPVDGCDYEDEQKSVEAHISAKSTGEHRGRFGREFREDFDAQREGAEPGSTLGESDGTDESADDPEPVTVDSEPVEGVSDSSLEVGQSEAGGADETPQEPAESGAEEADTSGELASRTEEEDGEGSLVALLVVAATVWYFVVNRGGNGQSTRRRP
jgi:hypothetical protein